MLSSEDVESLIGGHCLGDRARQATTIDEKPPQYLQLHGNLSTTTEDRYFGRRWSHERFEQATTDKPSDHRIPRTTTSATIYITPVLPTSPLPTATVLSPSVACKTVTVRVGPALVINVSASDTVCRGFAHWSGNT